jgi:hypothetical protein
MDGGRQFDAVAGPLQGGIKAREEPETARQHGSDAPQVAAQYLPLQECAAVSGSRECGKEVKDLLVAGRW